jgi:hypothetical protein
MFKLTIIQMFFKEDRISDRDYNRFVDTGEINQKILTRIAKKVMKTQQLNEREMAIFVGKTSEINEILRNI